MTIGDAVTVRDAATSGAATSGAATSGAATSGTARHSVPVGQDPTWWARGLNVDERLALGPPPAPDRATDRDRRRLRRWRTDHDRFARRLAALGTDEDGLLGLLAEAPADLAGRAHRPAWAAFVEETIAATADDAGPAPHTTATGVTATETTATETTATDETATGEAAADGTDWTAGFATILAPFVDAAWARLTGPVAASAQAGHADVAGLRRSFTDRLTGRLVALGARTLVLELNVARVTGRLSGDNPADRFAGFVRRLATRSGLAALLGEYAVLGRLLGQACLAEVDAGAELLARFDADRATIVAALLDGVDPGRLVALDVRGDEHLGGRAVSILRFAGGDAVVYKPRPVDIHLHFNDIVRWLDDRLPGPGLTTLPVVRRAGYGWVGHVAYLPCATEDGVARFYRRLGMLMALLYALDGVDVHRGNLIAHGDQPVLVDVETLLHPALPTVGTEGDPAARALASSVDRISLLPRLMIGDAAAVDLSGLGGDHGDRLPFDVVGWDATGTDRMRLVRRSGQLPGSENRPRIDDRPADPADYLPALLAGFRRGYDAIVAHREELVGPDGPLANCRTDEVRVVARPTRAYAKLADESTHPDVLRDALDRDRVLDLLWMASAGDPVRERLVPDEIADLWAGDIPLFTGRPGTRDLAGTGGRALGDVVVDSGLTRVINKIRQMGGLDRYNQEWVIRAAIAIRTRSDCHTAVDPVHGPGPAVAADPQRLLGAARVLADQLVACGFRTGRRTNWWGVQSPDRAHWTIAPLGAGLGDGYCGVALFLAQLAAVTGQQRFAECAREALDGVAQVLEQLGTDPRLPGLVGCGGFDGLGGVAYGLARAGTLLGDPAIAGLGARAVTLLGTAIGDERRTGVIDGLAGGVAAMLAVYEETGLPDAWTAARRCAEALADPPDGDRRSDPPGGDRRSDPPDGDRRSDPPATPAGFGWGSTGAGWALTRFGAAGGGERYTALGRAVLDAATTPDRGGWCHGGAGTVLACDGDPGRPGSPRAAAALAMLAGEPPSANHSLCHGELGRIEALAVAARGGAEEITGRLVARVGAVVASIDRYGARCGTPGSIDSPGLLTGLAGIGYGLLRLAFPDQVPSILLLHPAAHLAGHRPAFGKEIQ